MNFAEIYDCFTMTTMITLEDYGFCKKGEGKDFVKNGRIEIGGELPVNTHGGLLSQAHIEGMLHVTEAARQLRGNEVEPERQVKNARAGIVSGHGGSLCMHASLIFEGTMSETKDHRGRAVPKVEPFLDEPEAKPFWANLTEHKLTAQRCNACDKYFTYRRKAPARTASLLSMNGARSAAKASLLLRHLLPCLASVLRR